MKITKEILKQMIAEEMANAGVVNEEDKCAKIRAKEEELHNLAKGLEYEGNLYADQYYGEARSLRDDNKECFPEYFKDKAPEPGKSGYDVTKKQYGLGEQMSEVFQSGITVHSPKEAHKYYVEAVKDYRAVAGKIYDMLPEEQKMGEGEKAIFGTEYAIKETMKLVKFALENEGMPQQQKDELIEDLDSLDYEADNVKEILVLVNPTPEELENLVYDLIEKYEVANAYLMGILEGRYKDTSDADLEDMGKQMGLGLQEESKKDMLKRIVAEELAKMEIEAMKESGELDEITFSGDGIDFSDKEGIRTSDDDMSVTGILSKMGSDSEEGRLAKAEMDKFLQRHRNRALVRMQKKRDEFNSVTDPEHRRLIDAARERSEKKAEDIQKIRDSLKDRNLTRQEAAYIMSIDGSDDLKDYNDDAPQPRDKIGS